MNQDNTFALHPAQSTIAKDNHRFRVVCAGRRFGKSTLVAWEMFVMAICQKDARIPYYAPTRDDARDIMWGPLKKVCEPLLIDANESRLELKIKNNFGTESLIILYGWEAVQERGKGVGVKNNHIFFDEVSKYREFFQGWEEVLLPTLIDLKGGATFISTPNGFNHFYDLYNYENDPQVNAQGEWKSFHYTSYDNPNIDPEEINKKKISTSEDRFAQEYLADFRKTEGLVYKEFSRALHTTIEEPELVVETMGGVDFGFTHPTAILTVKKDYNNIYWITDEWIYPGKTEDEVCEYVASQKFNKVYPDPENASAIEALKRRTVNVREVKKSRGSVLSGINMVRELLKQNRLLINKKKCPKLIQSFEIYSYAETAKGKDYANEIPAHDGSDPLDALRYVVMTDATSSSSGPKVFYGSQSRPGGLLRTNKFRGRMV
jgi:PBSX family phage terminase large subunit